MAIPPARARGLDLQIMMTGSCGCCFTAWRNSSMQAVVVAAHPLIKAIAAQEPRAHDVDQARQHGWTAERRQRTIGQVCDEKDVVTRYRCAQQFRLQSSDTQAVRGQQARVVMRMVSSNCAA